MTPTDDECREVARRLRGLDYSDLQESLICAYLDALGIEGYTDWVGIAHRLAELIEPSRQCPCYDSGRHWCSIHDVPAIDREALLALADEMGRVRSRCDFCIKKGDCDWADETICLESRIDDYAQCIREALGVQDG